MKHINSENFSEPKHGTAYGVFHFTIAKTGLLTDVVSEHLQIAREAVAQLLWLGAIYCNGRRVISETTVNEGDYLRVHTRPRRYDIQKIEWANTIVFKNSEFVVVNKPATIPVHATVDNYRENMVEALSAYLQISVKVTHRLDNVTSGLMVFALTHEFQKSFNALLRASQVKKIYRVRVHGTEILRTFPTGKWVHYMQSSPRAPKTVSREASPDRQICIMHILYERTLADNQSELLIELETGRTHQIRAQLACEGFPVVGDGMYGSALPSAEEAIELQSYRICFGVHEFTLK